MHYREFVPAPPLSACVDRLWVLEHADGRGIPPQEILPDGSMELVFHLGDPFERQIAGGEWERQDRMLAAGQLTGPLVVRPAGSMLVVGVRFRPGGARLVLRVPQHELTGDVLPLAAVAPRTAARLWNAVQAGDSAEDCAMALAEALGGYISDHAMDPAVDHAVALIKRTQGAIGVDALAERCNLSGRQLERRFLECVGLPPKRLARIVRFQHARHVLQSTDEGRASGAALAARLGYSDQAHFIRDFRAFAGHTPTQHAALQSALNALFSGV
jgi:AraC-like DNA-binding protein